METIKNINEENFNAINNLKKERDMKKSSVNAVINGEVRKIVLGYSVYNMERPKDKKDLKSLLDKEKMLSVTFHLAPASIFWKEGIELKDANGDVIPQDTPNVYVPCDTPDTYWRFETDDILKNVEIHEFASLQEYGQAIGITTLYSRKLNNVEQIGVAAIASKNGSYSAIHELAQKFNVPMNTAMSIYGVRLKQAQTMQLAMGLEVKDIPELKRSKEQAERLIETIGVVFGEKEMGKRYAVNAINAVIKKYDFDTVIDGLEKIPASTITIYKMSECHEKEACLVAEMVIFIEELRKAKAA